MTLHTEKEAQEVDIIKEWPANETVEAIAQIIDPGAFTVWYDGTGPEAKTVDNKRQKYHRSRAFCKAHNILRILIGVDAQHELRADILASWLAQGFPEKIANELADEQARRDWTPDYSGLAGSAE